MAKERLQKILAHGGIASRRAAETMIEAGRVRVNGEIVKELGAKADGMKDRIEIDGKRVVAEAPVYLVLHKPRGVVSTLSDPEGRPTVRDILARVEARVYPIGRLDFATSGVLLATNDGDLAEALMHPKKNVPKTYVLKVRGLMRPDDVEKWRTGIRLEDGMTLPAKVSMLRHEDQKTWLELTIREGRNQQIRRMGDATSFPVMRLARTSFAGITSEGLRPGEMRALTRDELMALKKEFGVPRKMPPPVDLSPMKRGALNARIASSSRKAGRSVHAPSVRAEARSFAGPRYGGGSPGRRSVDVTEDWGGGSGRGRSSGSTSSTDDAPRSELGGGGRRGRTRTTGTSGGVRAPGGTFDASSHAGPTRPTRPSRPQKGRPSKRK